MKKLILLLSLLAAHPAFAALASTIVWEIRNAGTDTNGGGYKTGASGTDYTLQSAAQVSGTVGTSTASTTFVDAVATFTSAMVGNVLHLNSGTGTTVGFYEITAFTDAHTVTLDRASGTYTAGVWSVGGAVKTIGAIGSATVATVAGNMVCVQADSSYSPAATDTFSGAGTATNPILIIGYKTTRPVLGTTHGDGFQGRTNSGALVTTNSPTLAYASSTDLNCSSATFLVVENLNVTCTSGVNAGLIRIGTDSVVKSCAFSNASTGGSSTAISLENSRATAFDCDATMTGASGGLAAIDCSGGNVRVIVCRCKVTSTAPGIQYGSNSVVLGNVCYASGGSGIKATNTGSSGVFVGNTSVGNASDGITLSSSTTVLSFFLNNMLTDSTAGYGINLGNTATPAFIAYTRTRDNSSGAINSGTGWVNVTNYSPVTTDTGGPETDYVASGSNDYRLIAASPAVGVAWLNSASMGAIQKSAGGGGQSGSSK